MCSKCDIFHSNLFVKHHKYYFEEEKNQRFNGFCKEEDHFEKLVYFCKNHNILCCAACLCKIKGEGNGQHTECNVCSIKDIKTEKKGILNNNILTLELFNILLVLNEPLSKIHSKLGAQKIIFNINSYLWEISE